MASEWIDQVERLLQTRRLTTTRLGGGVVRSSFRVSPGLSLPLVCGVEDTWLKLSVVPLGRLPADPSRTEALYRSLLRWNAEIMFARLSLDEDGDIVLSVELELSRCTDGLLGDAVDALTFYGSRYAGEIRALVS
jgi:hypothetical protein